jgi:hypothetical protein
MKVKTVMNYVKSEIRMIYNPFLTFVGVKNFHMKQRIPINTNKILVDTLITVSYTTPKQYLLTYSK